MLNLRNFALSFGSAYVFHQHKKMFKRQSALCCGIVGYVGSKDAQAVLVDGVKLLQNRGYDSCGISTISPLGEMYTTKFASRNSTSDCIDLLSADAPKIHKNHHIGIGHTRWATHGAKTDINAHPHHDYKDRFSIVHNGTIFNYVALKQELISNGIVFRSDTDTEVIVNLISWYFDTEYSLLKAVTKTIQRLQGTWGFAVISKDSNEEIVLARNGSPLLVGCSENEVYVASEPAALANYTNQFVGLNDGEVCALNPSGIQNLIASRDLHDISNEAFALSPTPYAHWTLKEIMEQAGTVEQALNFGGRLFPVGYRVKLGGLELHSDTLMTIKHLVITGCGTSLYAGMYGEILMHCLGCFETVQCVDAAEFAQDKLPRSNNAGLLLLSQSGETLDTIRYLSLLFRYHTMFFVGVIRAFRSASALRVPCFSVVNVVGSQLARLTNCGVYSNAGREVAVASTKAFTSQIVVLALIAVWFSQNQGKSGEKCQMLMSSLCRLPLTVSILLKNLSPYEEIAQRLRDCRTMFVLGTGLGYPVALEGALKIKEISYIHAEGFSAGALKHGPLALIDDKEATPVILICAGEERLSLLENTAQQLKSRGAYLILIVDNSQRLASVADTSIVIPHSPFFIPLLSAISLQLLAYHLALVRGLDPDKPRGLAKTVTVS